MLKTDDRANETSTTIGAGDLTLLGAVAKFFSLTANVPIGSIVQYGIVHQTLNEFELGIGYCSSATNFKRIFVTRSSNANALVNFSAGTKDVFYSLLSDALGFDDFGSNLKLVWEGSNAAAVTSYGGTLTFTGTATLRTPASTNSFTRKKRSGIVGAAVAASLATMRVTAGVNSFWFGNNTNLGGFIHKSTFGCSDAATVAGARQFAGMRNAAPTNIEPASDANNVGVGHGAADTNLKMYWAGSTAQTPVDLGVNFPVNTLSADIYQLILYQPAKDNTRILYQVTRLNTGHIATGVLTGTTGTQLPATTTSLSPAVWRSNNASALAVGLDIFTGAVVDLSTA